MVIDSNEVDEEGSSAHHCWNKEGSNEHLLNPSPSCKKGYFNETVSYSSLFFFLFLFISKDSRIYMFDYFSHKKAKEISNNILHEYKSKQSFI